eukprot:TRINITY_DN1642_c0_g1_i6.p1 TRINITY_DN1642_c0_g1~~TRINITY_DN1642_c0_g1_i6.p1  ORF type:complete len:467 (-),score=87.81 TRINITY_DN1642_c0_g1_i6:164-1564(-)
MVGVPAKLVTALLLSSGTRAAKVRVDYSNDAVVEKTEAELHVQRVHLRNFNNVQYAGDFTIGRQTIPVIYDTGSFETIALSTECTDCPPTLAKFNEDDSNTFEKGPKKGFHKYVSGWIKTQEGYDDLRLGSSASNPYVAKDMTMWMVQEHTMAFWKNERAIFSGIVGLSHVEKLLINYSGDNDDRRSLLKQMKIAAFGLCLKRGWGEKGQLDFGFTGHQMKHRHPGAFTTVNVHGAHWGVRLSEIDIEGHDTKAHCKPHCTAMIDSGTSLLGIPTALRPTFMKLMAKVQTSCEGIDKLPEIEFRIGGKQITLPPKAWVHKGKTFAGMETCKGAFTFVDSAKHGALGDTFILGMPFLRYHYTVFDRKENQIHIANANDNCEVAKGQTVNLAIDGDEFQEETDALDLHAGETTKSNVKHQLSAGRTAADYSQPTEVGNFDDVIYGRFFDGVDGKIDTPWINSDGKLEG